MSLRSSFLNRRWFVGPDHLLLREAICRATHDRVQPVQHMGSPVMRQDQEIQRPWHLLLPQVQGLATVRSQKRHLEAEGRESLSLLFLHSFSLMPTAKTAFDLTRTAKCAVTVGFPLTITLLYLSFTFIFWLIRGTEQRVTLTAECHLLLIHFILIDFNVWLPAMFTLPPPLSFLTTFAWKVHLDITYFWISNKSIYFSFI